MKKLIFMLTCFILCCYFDTRIIKAETMNLGEDGSYAFVYTIHTSDVDTTYYFEFTASGYPISEGETSVFYINSLGEYHFLTKLTTETYETDEEGIWLQSIQRGSATVSNDTDIQTLVLHCYVQYPSIAWEKYEVKGSLQEAQTPTPTPIPAPSLELNAYIEEGQAIAKYSVNGSTLVSSYIEFYEKSTLTNSEILINSEEFVSGSGSAKERMEPGKNYYYRLYCVYEQDGVQYEKEILSDNLMIADMELEDYRENGKITNFRTLILYIWEKFMALELTIEGYTVSFQQLFVYSMAAILVVSLLKGYSGR